MNYNFECIEVENYQWLNIFLNDIHVIGSIISDWAWVELLVFIVNFRKFSALS
jgi:hypothetical protein